MAEEKGDVNLKNSAACLYGVLLSVLIIALIEVFFIANARFYWLQPIKYRQISSTRSALYDLSQLNLDYLKNIEPYAAPHDFSDPSDYSETFKFAECSERRLLLEPYWIAAKNCRSRIILRKKNSKRVVYDQFYSFNKHGLRVIPAAVKSENFLLFLGCSYTYGEGIGDNKIFPNLVTAKIGSVNAFNLGMGGYGPHLTLRLLQKDGDDIRLQGIHGKNGIAVYTFIDDHFRRLLGSVSWLSNADTLKEPYYYLDGEDLKYGGSFRKGRPIRTLLYRTLSKSKTAEFFGVELPVVRDRELRLFVKTILEMQKILASKYNVKKFIFSIYPNSTSMGYASQLRPLLEKEGIIVFDFSNIDMNSLFKGRQSLLGNWHPSELAHRFYADLLVHEMHKRKIAF